MKVEVDVLDLNSHGFCGRKKQHLRIMFHISELRNRESRGGRLGLPVP